MKRPADYVEVFGKPEPPDKDTCDSGRFHLGLRGSDTPGERGDILLIYAAAGKGDNKPCIPGIGVVLTKTKESIFFRYLPFSSPIPKEQVDRTFTEADRNRLTGIASNTYWLFEISHESFSGTTMGVSIHWP